MAGLRWANGSPAQIAARIQELASQAPEMVHAIAIDEASRGESRMKDDAPWTDRTGQARGGLYGQAERYEGGSRIHLGGTAAYQPFLELGTRYMRPYPVIVPTADAIHVEATKQVAAAMVELFA